MLISCNSSMAVPFWFSSLNRLSRRLACSSSVSEAFGAPSFVAMKGACKRSQSQNLFKDQRKNSSRYLSYMGLTCIIMTDKLLSQHICAYDQWVSIINVIFAQTTVMTPSSDMVSNITLVAYSKYTLDRNVAEFDSHCVKRLPAYHDLQSKGCMRLKRKRNL